MDVLPELLRKLWQDHSYCPYCGGEYVHQADCVLIGFWPPDHSWNAPEEE